MNNTFKLLKDAARYHLDYDFDAVAYGFAQHQQPQFGYALLLCGPNVPRQMVELILLYDRAGCTKKEMGRAIWAAARDFYDEALLERANAAAQEDAECARRG